MVAAVAEARAADDEVEEVGERRDDFWTGGGDDDDNNLGLRRWDGRGSVDRLVVLEHGTDW